MQARDRRHRWRLHAALVVGLGLCTLGFVVELGRGVHGHLLAWAYVVEWPLFAICGTVAWWRLVRESGQPTRPRPLDHGPVIPADDPELVRWQAYVERMETRRRAPEGEVGHTPERT
jgi:hypothetical protein